MVRYAYFSKEGVYVKYLWRGMLAAAVLLVTGCGSLEDPNAGIVGSGEKVIGLSAEQVKKGLIEKGLVDESTTVYGYDAYKITYTTTDEEGEPVEASGLMTVPTGMPEAVTEQIGFSIVSDDHGTIFADREAPTFKAEHTNTEVDTPIIFSALAGFVTLQPDYIGFGDSSEHYHPYLLKKSLANATVDFIKAAKKFAEDNGIRLNGQLFVTGYSEGGYAAMAALQKIEKEGELHVTMAAPMAGPYAMSGMAIKVLEAPQIGVPSFMANVGYAYALASNKEVDIVINAPYASQLENLLGGDYNRTQIDGELTHKTTGESGLFRQDFVNSFFQGAITGQPDWFLGALLQNDVYRWKATTPIRLVQCMGDDVVPFAMSQIAEGNMTEMGTSDISIVPVEIAITKNPNTPLRLGHGECGAAAYKVAAGLFAKERNANIGY